MSRHLLRTLYTVAALAGLVVCGAGLAGVAAAAPAPSSPGSSAPAAGGPAPVPSLLRPLDASDGLLGIQRGGIQSASTPDMSQIPVARQLPMIDITPLPARNTPPESIPDGDAADDPSTDSAAVEGAPTGQ
jgi:hypothetical protein